MRFCGCFVRIRSFVRRVFQADSFAGNVLPLSFMDSNFAYDVEKEVEKYLSGQR